VWIKPLRKGFGTRLHDGDDPYFAFQSISADVFLTMFWAFTEPNQGKILQKEGMDYNDRRDIIENITKRGMQNGTIGSKRWIDLTALSWHMVCACVVNAIQGTQCVIPYERAGMLLVVSAVGVGLVAIDTHFSSVLLGFPSEVEVSSASESTHVRVLDAVAKLEVELARDSASAGWKKRERKKKR
jgi:hypothetical protein